MMISVTINEKRTVGVRNPMIYGHFIEHFHRQIYGGVYDPGNPLSDEDGFRTDVLDAMKKIRIPILRWPGGCFVSAYHWKDAVGSHRTPYFDKAWRVEDPSTFGTDEYIKLCRKLGCEPYICTNAGTGTLEEMSDWVEYCNLENEGRYAKWRIENGYENPHKVKYWSIGNENYGSWEIGAKNADEWGRLVREAVKMIKRVDPSTELSAAALSDTDWNLKLLNACGRGLDWVSIHQYWDPLSQNNNPATYEQCMACTKNLSRQIDDVRGLLTVLHLEDKIKIAFDEWNLRGWHHPKVAVAVNKEDYLTPRDENDDNSTYTMADAVFTACFLNTLNRNCDIVGMANFSPVLNTRGCIYSHDNGIVLRSTYHVFDLYVNYLGDTMIDLWSEDGMPSMKICNKKGESVTVDTLDLLATKWSDREGIAIAAVNKHPDQALEIAVSGAGFGTVAEAKVFCIEGNGTDSYNDIGRNEVYIKERNLGRYEEGMKVRLEPHSVNVIQVLPCR